jgi:hypothetical protein
MVILEKMKLLPLGEKDKVGDWKCVEVIKFKWMMN